ncbi:MAG: hypothetical protein AAGM38_00910, partial [Pseudomonadota bacterium]
MSCEGETAARGAPAGAVLRGVLAALAFSACFGGAAAAQSSRDDSLIGGGVKMSCRDAETQSRRVQIAGGQDARVEDFPF